jgi:tetratricopeptide (TPR) repeat protein
MLDSSREHRQRTIRLERIRSKCSEFGIKTNTQLYELVQKRARELMETTDAKSQRFRELSEIALWSDEQCRQCIAVRGGTRYRTFVYVVCHLFADLDVSPESTESKLQRINHFIWSLEGEPEDRFPSPASSAESKTHDFPFVRQMFLAEDVAEADLFYNAVPQGLSAVMRDLDVERDAYKRVKGLREAIFLTLNGGASRIIAVNGIAGSGKSVLLDRVVADVIREGYQAYKCHTALVDPNTIFSKLLDLKAGASGPVLFVFDDCYRMFARGVELSAFFHLDLRTAAGPPAAIVLSDNWYIRSEGEDLISEAIDGKRTLHNLIELSLPEADQLVDKIYAAERSGAIAEIKCTLPKAERLNLLNSRHDRLVIIALLKLRYGKNIAEIMSDEYRSIEPVELRDVYRDAAILDALGIATPHHYIRRRLGGQPPQRGVTKALATLLSVREDGYHIRHPLLVSPLLRAIYPEPEDRSLALSAIIRSLNLRSAQDREFWLRFAIRPEAARGISRLFLSRKELTRQFLDDLRTMEADFIEAELGASFYCLLGTIFKDVLFELDVAFDHFAKSYEADSYNPYVIRQLAWTTLKLGRLADAETYCREAVSNWPDDPRTLSDAAFIMSWCSRAGFEEAGKLYEEAAKLAPEDKSIARKWERHQEAASVAKYFVGETLSDTVLEEIRAPSFIWRTRRHARKQYSKALFRELSGNLRKERLDLEEVEEIASSAEGLDRRLSGLLRANIARAEYERWYHLRENVDLVALKRRFLTAIDRCPNDPFVRCWYGTFLKEVEADYEAAEKEYEAARSLAKGSKAEYLIEHPMILNNIALLTMDAVYRQLKSPERLRDAYAVLLQAIKRMGETGSEFRWPISTIDQLRQQAKEFKIELPEEATEESSAIELRLKSSRG